MKLMYDNVVFNVVYCIGRDPIEKRHMLKRHWANIAHWKVVTIGAISTGTGVTVHLKMLANKHVWTLNWMKSMETSEDEMNISIFGLY